MPAPDDDDDHEIGDHGTVVMPRSRKMPFAPGAPLGRPLPPAQPPPPHAATMNPAVPSARAPMPSAQASSALPTLPACGTYLPVVLLAERLARAWLTI